MRFGKKAGPLTTQDVILLAALDLVNSGNPAFMLSDLVIQVWIRDRARYGLAGHEDKHPDNKRVSCELVANKRRTVLTDRFLERIGRNCYRLTNRGVQAAINVQDGRSRYQDVEDADRRAEADLYVI